MFFVVFGIVGLSYGPYVLWPVVWRDGNTFLSSVCIGIFHVLITLLLGSYVMCVFTDPGSVPQQWNAMVAADDRLAAEHRCARCSVGCTVACALSHICS